jgi:hypothetical protein
MDRPGVAKFLGPAGSSSLRGTLGVGDLEEWFLLGRLTCWVVLASGLWRSRPFFRLGCCGCFRSSLVNFGHEEFVRVGIPIWLIRDRRGGAPVVTGYSSDRYYRL